jgi:hypothetical protein
MNKKIHLALLMVAILLGSACNTVYKKHYGDGYTFLKKSQKSNTNIDREYKNTQQQSIVVLEDKIKKEKEKDVNKAEQSFETIHKKLNHSDEGYNQKADRSKRLVAALKPLFPLSQEPKKSSNLSTPDKKPDAEANQYAEIALILAIAAIISFFLAGFVSILAFFPLLGLFGLGSLILAIVSLVMAKRAKRIANLNGFDIPHNAKIAKILSWIVLGFNILALLVLMLMVLIILLLLRNW